MVGDRVLFKGDLRMFLDPYEQVLIFVCCDLDVFIETVQPIKKVFMDRYIGTPEMSTVCIYRTLNDARWFFGVTG